MKLLKLLSIILCISTLAGSMGYSQHENCTHFSGDEFTNPKYRKMELNSLAELIANRISFLTISDEVRLNLYRQTHEPTIHFILESRFAFAHEVATRIHSREGMTNAKYNAMFSAWVEKLKSDIELIEFTKEENEEIYSTRQENGPCVNMDFEEGTFNGWILQRGKQPGNAPYAVNNMVNSAPNIQHFIFNGGNDPVVGIPRVNPDGGQYSARLGNGNSSNADVAIMRQTYMVDATNTLFSYSYAIVVQDPGHTLNEQPYFVLRMYDQAGNDIPCGSYSVQSNSSNPDFQSGPGSVLYQNWKTSFAPLEAYIGQNVTIEFRAADCSQFGHYGYAYVDASCSVFEIETSTGDNIICGNEFITLTAPSGAASYQWSNGATTQSIQVNQPGSYEVFMIPVTGINCGVSRTIEVIQAPLPVPNFSTQPAQICIGSSIQFIDNSTVSNGFIESWQWNFGNGVQTQTGSGAISNVSNTSGTYTNLSHEYQSTGVQQVTLTVESDLGCTAQVTHPVTINPLPNINAGPDILLCPNESFTPNAQGGVSYVWDNGLVNGQQATIGSTTTTFTVVGTDGNGCSNSDSFVVQVEQIITPDAGPDFAICLGDQAVLSGAGATSYQWNNGVVNGVPFAPNQTTTYTVTHTTPNGCVGSDDVTITVNPLPNIQAGNPVAVCDGQSVILSGSGGVSYEWNNGVVNNVPFFPQTVGSQTYTVTGTDANGCVNTNQVVVTVHGMPQPAFQVMNNEGCSPVTPTFVPMGNAASSTCVWNFGNGQVSQVCENLQPVVYDQAGCYNVSFTVTTEFGCSQTITQNNVVCVWENPVANFTPSPAVLSSINPVSSMLNYSYNAVNYEWYFSDGGTSNQISPSYVFNTSGNTSIVLVAISAEGCIDTAYGSIFVNEELVVYVPNTFTPDNDNFNEVFKPILYSGFDPYSYHLIIFNRWGEVMFESYDANFGWDGTYGGNKVQDGTYIWMITVKRNFVDDREVFKGHVNVLR